MSDDGRGSARPRVVIIGAGFGGLEAAKALGGQAVDVTVVDRLNYHLFQPLLYQVAMAALASTDVAYPIRSILHHHANIEVMLGEVVGIDLAARRVRLADGSGLPYDYLVVAAGAGTSYFGHDDWAAIAPGLKDLDDALEIRRRVLLALEAAERETDPDERRRLMTFVVVGGGPTGVELAGAIADLSRDILHADFHRIGRREVKVILVEAAPRILTAFDPPLSDKARQQLADLGVEVRTDVRVENIDAAGVRVGGQVIPAATVLWGAGVRPSPLARALGLPLDRGGRVLVEADCSVPGHPEAFVIGDMAALTPEGARAPLPGISPVAIQEGRATARNILATVHGEPRRPFHYLDKGFMATIGRARAVAQIRKLRLSGLFAWLAWAFVHLWYLVGFRNRLAVFLNWIWAYVISNHGARIVIGRQGGSPGSVDGRQPLVGGGAGRLVPQLGHRNAQDDGVAGRVNQPGGHVD
ncbi:MAG TPA: NAD(P)/FAD-dependent oxidoreductase, partial [Polyangia bacterium]|nr:NAD(P)/FAD-dependent oxidoreductase [Polyangia bacterium]